MARTKITREHFSNLIKDVPDWESCLTDLQKTVIQKWLHEKESFAQIARELNVSRKTTQSQIRGENQFGTNGAIRKIAKYKADLTKKEKESNNESDI